MNYSIHSPENLSVTDFLGECRECPRHYSDSYALGKLCGAPVHPVPSSVLACGRLSAGTCEEMEQIKKFTLLPLFMD